MQQSQKIDISEQEEAKIRELLAQTQNKNTKWQNMIKTSSPATNIQTFSSTIDHYSCQFSLADKQVLTIVIASDLDSTVFRLILTRTQKKQIQQLNFFESLEELYEYLTENCPNSFENTSSKSITINQSGTISIKVISRIGKKQRNRVIELKTQRISQQKQEYIKNSFKKINKNIVELKKQINFLKEQQKKLSDENNELRTRYNSYGIKIKLFADKTDPHYSKYKQSDRRIMKVADNTTYQNIYNIESIPKTGLSYFNVKIINSLAMNIMIGVASKSLKGITNSYSNTDFIGFYLYGSGYIWQKENQHDLNLHNYPIEKGTTITTNINMDLGYINWQICGVKVCSSVIPLELRAKILYPVIMMTNINDVVQLDR